MCRRAQRGLALSVRMFRGIKLRARLDVYTSVHVQIRTQMSALSQTWAEVFNYGTSRDQDACMSNFLTWVPYCVPKNADSAHVVSHNCRQKTSNEHRKKLEHIMTKSLSGAKLFGVASLRKTPAIAKSSTNICWTNTIPSQHLSTDRCAIYSGSSFDQVRELSPTTSPQDDRENL